MIAETETPKTRVVVFDFDGTIVNSMEAFADIAARVMPRRLPVKSSDARRLYLETSGIPFFQQLEVLFPGNSANAATAGEFEAEKLLGYFDEPIFEDAPDTVSELRSRGIKAAVSSNNFQDLVDRFVGQTGIEFDMVCGFRDGFAKGRDHFVHIEREFGVTPAEITFVGDSLKDGERADGHGVAFIGKTGIFTRTQFLEKFPNARVISALSELKGIIPCMR
ncbi:MAG TPA: HAD hydrolase-like protein [bacterium]|nr:HAD hydrolase-like protein [bacterium]